MRPAHIQPLLVLLREEAMAENNSLGAKADWSSVEHEVANEKMIQR